MEGVMRDIKYPAGMGSCEGEGLTNDKVVCFPMMVGGDGCMVVLLAGIVVDSTTIFSPFVISKWGLLHLI